MAKPRRSKVGLLFLGGTVLDARGRRGDLVTGPKDIKPWLEAMAEMEIIADIDGWFVSAGLALGMADWSKAAKLVAEHYDQVDGFVVIHQLGSLPAAATALSLMLDRLDKPVVLVGSAERTKRDRQKLGAGPIIGSKEFGAKASFINAAQVAVSDVAEVVVVYGSHIIRGASIRTGPGPQSNLIGMILGKIDFGIRFFGSQRPRRAQKLVVRPDFDPKVTAVEYFSGLETDHLVEIARTANALIVTASSDLTGLPDAVDRVSQARGPSYPIIIITPAEAPIRWPNSVIHLVNVSQAMAIIGVMWALGQTRKLAKLRQLLKNSLSA